ncbi:homocysteine S-methyltransferase [Kribbella turkmenica]|uniref:Homocysteine S-methyltransferase n=1 Tax=Kribbella turkmenica TaxID=2530375 RepID=A0A4R4WVU8_9ACTN|nr:homocysteine S-methyltransferase family protein [Kribbella turkmenica]TDD21772.1 homocysteine S-methyltransferase [Kribbella turkmenica]
MTYSDVLDGTRWVTDGGLETDLLFNHGIDLPEFASFPLLDDTLGRTALRRYYAEYAAIAGAADVGLLLETPTWRANPDWAQALGYNAAALDRANRAAVDLVRASAADSGLDEVRLSGVVGPRGDGYVAGDTNADAAAEYHDLQVRSLVDAGVDLVHAMTMTEPAEAIGVVRAARNARVPVAVSFTVETDGRLPSGNLLSEAITAMERTAPADWYGVNCAHPTHVLPALDGEPWTERLLFLRPNASTMSHQELDAMEVLDSGDIDLLVASTNRVLGQAGSLAVIGGCCGTDSRHVAALWGVAAPAR